MAIGSGQLSGKGYNNDATTSVKNGNFVSEPQTDFIFAIIGEELGFVGCCGVIFLLLLIVIQCILIGLKAKDTGGRIICGGVAALIGIQSFINISVATLILPNTGLSLPFVSYGLTSVVCFFMGIGLVFLGGGTTGGTDMMAAIIQKYLKHYSIAQIMQIIDAGVVLVGMYVFGIHKALYAIIAVYLVTKVSDGLIEGLKFSKAAYIITGKPDEISNMIINDLDRGVTGINAKGMYSGQDKLMLFCVVNKKEIVMLKEKVDEIDPAAFVIVTDAREVHGEGFIEKK